MKLPSRRERTADNIVRADADALIAGYGSSAYEQARTRAREERLRGVVDGNRPPGHWDRVRREIARLTAKADRA
jgi:hypothetical protein